LRDPVKKAEYESAKQVEAIKQQFESVINAQNEKIGVLTDNVSTLTDNVKSLLQALGGNKKGKE
jgi:HJR/Mrr/RecB family endonuclease